MAYLLLAACGVGMALQVIVNCEQRARCFAFLAVATAGVVCADWIFFGWLSMYTYHPNLASTPQADNVLGELLGDVVFVPGLAMVIVRYAPTAWGVFAATTLVTVLQVMFARFGLFSEIGWTPWYTAASFPFYFGGLIWYWRGLDEEGLLRGAHAKQVRLAVLLTMIALLSLFYRWQGLVETNLHVMPTYAGNQALGRFIWCAVVTVPVGYWVLSTNGRARWLRLGAVLLGFLLLNAWLPAAGIQFFRRYWSGPLDALAETAVILAAAWAQDRMRALAEEESGWRPLVLTRQR